MATYISVQRKRRMFRDDLVTFSRGLDSTMVEKIIIYAECLVWPGSDHIRETTFISQMSRHFNMNSPYMISIIFDDLDLKINFVFYVYDRDKDGQLTRNEIYNLLKPTIIQDVGEEQEEVLKDLTELVFKTVDYDGNGLIDVEEFRKLVKRNVLYIELLGQCLPPDRDLLRFKNLLLTRSTLQIKEFTEADMATFRIGAKEPNGVDEYYSIKLDL